MAAENQGKRTSSTLLLEELEALSQTLYQNHTARRTNSLALPRNAIPPILTNDGGGVTTTTAVADDKLINPKPRQRRLSLSPWRSRPKTDDLEAKQPIKPPTPQELKLELERSDSISSSSSSEKKGLWGWKPLRALSHIGMQKISCLFSVEVVTVQGLPASMNGLRLSVCVRKKETKDGAVHTMPSRVSQGAADFEETLFVRCNVYSSPSANGAAKFEPRPFLIYVFAVDAEELDFGRSSVDLSRLIQESISKSSEGTRIRQWDTSFSLSGKAKGGEVVLKLGFQLMEKDGGLGIYSQAEGQKSKQGRNVGSASGRKQSKSSFSIPSPRITGRAEVWTPSQPGTTPDFHGIDDLNLDEPAQESKMDDSDLPDFEVVEKGVELEEKIQSEDNSSEKRSVSSEVVKEVVQDKAHQARLTELDAIARQIKALESMMGDERSSRTDYDTASQASQRLDADEEMVTIEFLQLLEEEKSGEFTFHRNDNLPKKEKEGEEEDSSEAESKVWIPDLGKGLGPVVQTRNGGYLAATNPLNTKMGKKDTPKLAMQLSKPLILPENIPGFELFQKLAAVGLEALSSDLVSLMPVDELVGKTAEQVAFEGMASAIIQGRNKEGATSSAARAVAAVKTMATALSAGRKERVSTGIWNVSEEPLTADEILAQAMQKIESMAVESLKIQAEIAEEESPFDVSPIVGENPSNPLASSVPLEDWINNSSFNDESTSITIAVVVQLRDPLRRYEAVGGPVIALIKARSSDAELDKDDDEEEKRYKVESMHVGGVRVRTKGKKTVWGSEKQRLTAMQWLVLYGLGKAGKKVKPASSKGQDVLWSISSRVMADMWLKAMRNPDVKFNK